jgi:hypothetical protein
VTAGLELRCCWFLSGNNLAPTRDAYRRWLVCNLKTDLERPEERGGFKIPDLIAHASRNRSGLLRAALVILRAHAAAGYPNGGWAPLGSFEVWDRVVRGAVWFATKLDCNTTRRNAAEDAPDRKARLALMHAWSELADGGHKQGGVTAAQALRWAADAVLHPDTASHTHTTLADALMHFSRDGKLPSPQRIGNTLRAIADLNIEGLAFRNAGDINHTAAWRVDLVDANPAEPQKPPPANGLSGSAGPDFHPYAGAGGNGFSPHRDVHGTGNGPEPEPGEPESPSGSGNGDGWEVFEV